MYSTLTGATTLTQHGPGSDGNEVALHIPQSSNIAEASPSDCLVSYLGHSLGKSYIFADMQSGLISNINNEHQMISVVNIFLYMMITKW